MRAPETLLRTGVISEFHIFKTGRHDHYMLCVGLRHLGQHVFRNEDRGHKNPPALCWRLTIFSSRHNVDADLGGAWKI